MFVLMSFHSSTDGASPPPSLCSGSGISISSVFTRIYWRGLSINWSEMSTLKNISFTCDVGDDEGQDLPFALLRRPSEGIEPGIEKSVPVQVPDIEKH